MGDKTRLLIIILAVMWYAEGQVVQHFDHIIIGAGISGIATSLTLTNAKAQHLLIEARDRIGGRIKSFSFAGTTQDEGASYLHYPYDANPLHTLAKKFNVGQIPAKFDNEAIYYAANKSLSSYGDEQTAESVYSSLMDYIYN